MKQKTIIANSLCWNYLRPNHPPWLSRLLHSLYIHHTLLYQTILKNSQKQVHYIVILIPEVDIFSDLKIMETTCAFSWIYIIYNSYFNIFILIFLQWNFQAITIGRRGSSYYFFLSLLPMMTFADDNFNLLVVPQYKRDPDHTS